MFAVDPITQSLLVNLEFCSDFSSRDRSIVGVIKINGLCKTFLTFSSSQAHNKRCILIVITIQTASIVVVGRKKGCRKILSKVAYPSKLACTHLPDRGSDALTHEYVIQF